MDLKKFLDETINETYLINREEIPNIDLYMDQVTTFMESHLGHMKRNDDDKVLTKTMINNYAKNDLLPSPEKKRYTKEHVLLLTLIYYYKSVLSINDTKKILAPITEKYFNGKKGNDLSFIYDEIKNFEKDIIENAKNDIENKIEISSKAFENVAEKDSDYLKLFSFISLLSLDIYVKKQILESLIDTLDEPLSKEEKEKAIKKAKEDKEKALKKEKEDKERSLKKAREDKIKAEKAQKKIKALD